MNGWEYIGRGGGGRVGRRRAAREAGMIRKGEGILCQGKRKATKEVGKAFSAMLAPMFYFLSFCLCLL